jgi:hypothetical protein
LVAYTALFFALAGTSTAAVKADPFDGGPHSVFSARIVAAPDIDYWNGGIEGPTVMPIPGFGRVFVTVCGDSDLETRPGPALYAYAAFRNTSSRTLDMPRAFVYDPGTGSGHDVLVAPGEVVQISSSGMSDAGEFLIHSRSGSKDSVASVEVQAVAFDDQTSCDFVAEATMQAY